MMMDNYIECSKPVSGRKEGLQCDGCGLWNHRKCGTDIDRQSYRAAVRGVQALDWRCRPCRVYVFGTATEWSGKFRFLISDHCELRRPV